jgi:hypothetical protein
MPALKQHQRRAARAARAAALEVPSVPVTLPPAPTPNVPVEGKGKGKGKVAAAPNVPAEPEVWSEVLRLQRELTTAIARVEQLTLLSSASASSSTTGSINAEVPPPPEPVVFRESPRLPEHPSFTPLAAWPEFKDSTKCDFGDCTAYGEPCMRPPVGWFKLASKRSKGICKERLYKKIEEEADALKWAAEPSPIKVCRWLATGCESVKARIEVNPDDLIQTHSKAWQCPKCRESY